MTCSLPDLLADRYHDPLPSDHRASPSAIATATLTQSGMNFVATSTFRRYRRITSASRAATICGAGDDCSSPQRFVHDVEIVAEIADQLGWHVAQLFVGAQISRAMSRIIARTAGTVSGASVSTADCTPSGDSVAHQPARAIVSRRERVDGLRRHGDEVVDMGRRYARFNA